MNNSNQNEILPLEAGVDRYLSMIPERPGAGLHASVHDFYSEHGRLPIVTSLMEDDLYKITMQQTLLHHCPGAEAEYRFVCRTRGVDLRPLMPDIELELEHLSRLHYTESELGYLGTLRYIKPDFVHFLRLYRLHHPFVELRAGDEQLEIRIRGPQVHVMRFEIFLMSIVNELYFRAFDTPETRAEGLRRLNDKIEFIRAEIGDRSDFRLSDFGTRRRFSREWQHIVVRTLKERLPEIFTGSSNVACARAYGVTPIGTMAHEYLQTFQALAYRLVDSQKAAFECWNREYDGDLGIALTDVINLEAFKRDFGLKFCKLFDGVRHDSGDPFHWADAMIEHFESYRVDPGQKTLVFSDGLTVPRAIALFRHVGGRARTGFGIGTNLTNDLGPDPLNIVIKVLRVNGQPVAKISDAPGKTLCDDPGYIAYLKHVFGVEE
ncbi:nicotinate phosphoribosyltransferase [Methylocaldum marinum]|uniref:Nicotinate phosphoribosyltransferase n=1 Tax=Methylocaldum marinum TaxID=1432792 RepID=A0A286P3F0_9GAMM|nr:nicotinate phosphoribosyltransferase [Methylocaldum marinum]BBA32172.1 nicotinate phosphoribosyltransferase [Methylocaldum marinum]